MIREWNRENDYPILLRWWKTHKFAAPMQMVLPETGYVADECAAGFLYLSNSPLAMLEWVVCDPAAPKEKRGPAVNDLIDHICISAKLAGSLVIFTTTVLPAFSKRLKDLSFVETDHKVTHLTRVL